MLLAKTRIFKKKGKDGKDGLSFYDYQPTTRKTNLNTKYTIKTLAGYPSGQPTLFRLTHFNL